MISKILSGTFLAVAALQPAAASRPLTDSLTVASGLLASESVATPAPVTAQPESETDSIAQLRLRLQRKYIESTLATDGLTVIDTLATDNDAVQVVLYGNNTWKYVRNREIAKDSTIFEKYWDTATLFPIRRSICRPCPLRW